MRRLPSLRAANSAAGARSASRWARSLSGVCSLGSTISETIFCPSESAMNTSTEPGIGAGWSVYLSEPALMTTPGASSPSRSTSIAMSDSAAPDSASWARDWMSDEPSSEERTSLNTWAVASKSTRAVWAHETRSCTGPPSARSATRAAPTLRSADSRGSMAI